MMLKRAVEREDFGFLVVSTFFLDLTPSHSYILFVRRYPRRNLPSHPHPRSYLLFLFPRPVYVGPSQSLSPFTRSTPKGSGGRTLRICWGIWPRLIIRGILFRVRNTARAICSFQHYTLWCVTNDEGDTWSIYEVWMWSNVLSRMLQVAGP